MQMSIVLSSGMLVNKESTSRLASYLKPTKPV